MCSVISSCCNPMDCGPPDSSVHCIFQARILEWVAISYFRGFSQCGDQTHVSCFSCVGSQILYRQYHLEAKGLLILRLVLFSPHHSCLLASSEQTGSPINLNCYWKLLHWFYLKENPLYSSETSVIKDLKRTLKSLGLQHCCYLQLLMFVN